MISAITARGRKQRPPEEPGSHWSKRASPRPTFVNWPRHGVLRSGTAQPCHAFRAGCHTAPRSPSRFCRASTEPKRRYASWASKTCGSDTTTKPLASSFQPTSCRRRPRWPAKWSRRSPLQAIATSPLTWPGCAAATSITPS
ncbi:UNVERIFIED_CONTAM: hypothetical protein GTU68_029905, partial [Idotea baltica]|nr:hypothetical protein [Idotea baltica]